MSFEDEFPSDIDKKIKVWVLGFGERLRNSMKNVKRMRQPPWERVGRLILIRIVA